MLGVGREERGDTRFVSDGCGHTRVLLDGEEGECRIVAGKLAQG